MGEFYVYRYLTHKTGPFRGKPKWAATITKYGKGFLPPTILPPGAEVVIAPTKKQAITRGKILFRGLLNPGPKYKTNQPAVYQSGDIVYYKEEPHSVIEIIPGTKKAAITPIATPYEIEARIMPYAEPVIVPLRKIRHAVSNPCLSKWKRKNPGPRYKRNPIKIGEELLRWVKHLIYLMSFIQDKPRQLENLKNRIEKGGFLTAMDYRLLIQTARITNLPVTVRTKIEALARASLFERWR